MQVTSGTEINQAAGIVSTDISDVFGGKVITALSDWNDRIRKVQTMVTTSTGVSFNYGVQAGQGGFLLDNNAGVNGNVYSNGDITGSNNTFITGTAIAANSMTLSTDQANNTPTVPTNTINFRNSSSAQDFAQSFTVSTESPLNKLELYIRKTGSPSNATVRIVSNSGSSPGTTTFATATLSASMVTTSYGWLTLTPSSNPLLSAGTTYWIVVDNNSTNASNYYTIGANAAYSNGVAKLGQYAGSWSNTSPTGLDGYFKIYIGGTTSTISNITVGSSGSGSAHAHTVTNVTVAGNLYCQTGSGNNKACNTSLADPTAIGYPISDANIAEWKADAEAGGTITGNYTPTGAASSLGPKKIVGDLILPSDHALTITDTIWVTGNIIMPNNNAIYLDNSYGVSSGIIIADGYIRLDNNIDFYGSAASGSYIMLLTTSTCPSGNSCGGYDAVELSNNIGQLSDDVLVNAQQGRADFGNNAKVKEVTANQIHLSNNVTVTYESGVANPNFSSGPGGAWSVTSWKEIE